MYLAADDENGSVRDVANRETLGVEREGPSLTKRKYCGWILSHSSKWSSAFGDRFREELNELSQFWGALCKRRRRRSISLCGKTAQVSKRIHSIKARAETVGERLTVLVSLTSSRCALLHGPRHQLYMWMQRLFALSASHSLKSQVFQLIL